MIQQTAIGFGINSYLQRQQRNRDKMEEQREQRQQRLFNTLMTWLLILMIGIGLGYRWRMVQEVRQEVREVRQVAPATKPEAFTPVEIINTVQPSKVRN